MHFEDLAVLPEYEGELFRRRLAEKRQWSVQ